jgi:hypothetical protein
VWNDGCIASDNSIIRVQVTSSGSGFVSNFMVQRITDPTQAAQWASWTALPGSTGVMFQDGGCAVSNSAGTLRAFAQRGTSGNNLWVWTSTNNGASWSGPVSVLSPPGGALLKGVTSAGNNDVFFFYDVSGGDAIGCSFYTAGSWSTLNTWTLTPVFYGTGLAVAWGGTAYTVVYSDGYSLASCIFNPTGGAWSSGTTIAATTSDAIQRIAPHLSFADGLYTLTCTEADAGLLTGVVYSYPRLRQSADLLHWSQGTIVHDLTCTYGALALKLSAPVSGTSGARYYLAAIPAIYSAPAFQNSNTTQYLDVSASVLSYQRHEQVGQPARLEVVLDNAQGAYNALVTSASSYQPIGLNASLVLSEGYKTGAPDVVKVGVYHLDQNETLQVWELAASDASVWSYQPEIEAVTFDSADQRANHIIVSGKPPVGGAAGSLTTAEAFDDAHLHLLGLERLLYHVDPKLTSATQCSQKAAFLLAQEVRAQVKHSVTVPLNPALQLLDGITLTDSVAPRGSGQSATCRIIQVLARYDAQSALDELQLELEGM